MLHVECVTGNEPEFREIESCLEETFWRDTLPAFQDYLLYNSFGKESSTKTVNVREAWRIGHIAFTTSNHQRQPVFPKKHENCEKPNCPSPSVVPEQSQLKSPSRSGGKSLAVIRVLSHCPVGEAPPMQQMAVRRLSQPAFPRLRKLQGQW
jgi:hypothetical protein